jgi:methyl-accepting chemotaxis protein
MITLLIVISFLVITGVLILQKSKTVDEDGSIQRRVTIGVKILGGNVIILAFLIILALVTFSGLSSIGLEVESLEVQTTVVETITNIEKNQLEQSIWLERAFKYGGMGEAAKDKFHHAEEEFHSLATNVDDDVAAAISFLKNLETHSEEEANENHELVTRLEEIEAEHGDFDHSADNILSLLEHGEIHEAESLEEELALEEDHLNHSIEALLLDVEHSIQSSTHAVVEHERSMLRLMIIITSIAAIIGLVLAWFIAGSITNALARINEIAKDIAQGDLSKRITHTQKDEIGDLSSSINEMVGSLRQSEEDAEANLNMIKGVVAEVNKTAAEQKLGDIEVRAQIGDATGEFKDLVVGFNDALDSVIAPVMDGITILQEYAAGDLSNRMRDLPGKQIVLTDGLNAIQKNLRELIDEGVELATAAEQGDLEKRGDTTKFSGGYREIIAGMNATLDFVLKPITEASTVLSKMAEGDLSTRVTGDYKGDHAIIKDALNSSLDSMNSLLGEVLIAIDQVASGSNEVSGASQSLSQGATEQAASLEEVSSSVVEIGAQTKQNADNASQANQLANQAGTSATVGNEHMQQMLSAMTEINDSSAQVQKIIKVIDEIAFQTNLLALNAAVEAARAGVHGKGFAVVAEEVRNLAQRSAKAANETTDLIEGSVTKAENGGRIAEDTANALSEIVVSVTKVNDLVGEIDSASREQSTAISEISEAIGQIDQVTQSNTANAEESAAASEELAGQSARLKEMISTFTLSKTHSTVLTTQMPKQVPERSTVEARQISGVREDMSIVLPEIDEDSDFGSF